MNEVAIDHTIANMVARVNIAHIVCLLLACSIRYAAAIDASASISVATGDLYFDSIFFVHFLVERIKSLGPFGLRRLSICPPISQSLNFEFGMNL